MLGVCSGCTQPYYPEYESGYYRYAVKTDEDGSKEAYLIGFTKLGEQQVMRESCFSRMIWWVGLKLGILKSFSFRRRPKGG